MNKTSDKRRIKRLLNTKARKSRGMNIVKELLNMDSSTFLSLNTNDMRKVVQRLVPEVKRRVREFKDEPSPVVTKLQRSGTDFSTDKKDLNELRTDYTRIKHFLDAKTSEKKNWDDAKEKTIRAMRRLGIKFTDNNFKDIWQAYELLLELDKSVSAREFKYVSLRRIIELYEEGNKTEDQIATSVFEDFKDLYKKNIEETEEEDFYNEYYKDI